MLSYGHLFTVWAVWELRQEGRASPCLTSAGKACIRWLTFFAVLRMSVNDHENAMSVDFGVTDTFWQAGKFASTYVHIMRVDCDVGICTCNPQQLIKKQQFSSTSEWPVGKFGLNLKHRQGSTYVHFFYSSLKIMQYKHCIKWKCIKYKHAVWQITGKQPACNSCHLSQGLGHHLHLGDLHVHTGFFKELLLPVSLFPLQSDIFAVFSCRD